MNRYFLIFAGLISLLLFSCHKSGPDNNDNSNINDTTINNPPAPARSWFKLKTIIGNTKYSNNSSLTYNDSTDIAIDSVNKKIVIKSYSGTKYADSATETYTYNSNYQLTLYDHIDNYDRLYISRMEFVRDANGQVTKVISGYKNGLMATSEGAVTYAKRGDTTFITYLDSAQKHPDGYPDAQDWYQVALVGGKIVSNTDLPILTAYGADTVVTKYEYDAAGNLVTLSEKYRNITELTTYQRGSQAPQDLQKFIAQWWGDLFWFKRTKLLFPLQVIGYNGYILGNAVQSLTDNNVVVPFTNTFDANGNLTSLSYVGPPAGSPGKPTVTEQYKYRP